MGGSEFAERKLSDLRPCDSCGGALVPVFRVIEVRLGAINPKEANRTLHLAGFFGGVQRPGALALAEVMGDTPTPVKVEKLPHEELILCQACFCRPVVLAEVMERKGNREAEAGSHQ